MNITQEIAMANLNPSFFNAPSKQNADYRIQGIQVHAEHIGMRVIFVPKAANGDTNHRLCEVGTIKSLSHGGIAVEYAYRGTQITNCNNLVWKKADN